MIDLPDPDASPWTPSLACRVDRACDAFEARLRDDAATGQWPRLEDHLGQATPSERLALLRELLGLELDYRRRAGLHPTPEEYLPRFPDDAALVHELLAAGADAAGSPAPADAPTEAPPGRGPHPRPDLGPVPVVPGYERLELLGRGGMGVVYRAWQVRPGRLVALKMISPLAFSDPEELVARFLTEAEAVGRLKHPHIVPIYEMGDCDGRLYYSMEYVEGGSLEQKLTGPPWPLRAAAELLVPLAGAVHAVHEQGIIHRDLKPANVLLTRDGSPKVTDFGLAKLLSGAKVQTQSDAMLGTPSFMAPEQACGRSREATAATDVYALGAILYTLLTGRPPFLGETGMEVLTQIVADDPVPPSRLRPGVPRDLEVICLKCLHKEPRKRYASAAQLAERLRLFLDGKPIPDRPPGVLERTARAARRHPVAATLLGTTIAAVLGLLVGIVVYNAQLREQVRQGIAANTVRALLLEGQKATEEKRWPEAKAALDRAWDTIQAEPALAELRGSAEPLRQRVRDALAAREARAFTQKTLGVLFEADLRGGDKGQDPAWLLDRMRKVVGRVEDLLRERRFDTPEQQGLIEDCQECLLLLADAVLRDGRPNPPEAGTAVGLLQRAARLGPVPHAYRTRLARHLDRVGLHDNAAEERDRAAALPATGAADLFFSGLDHYRARKLGLATRQFDAARRAAPGHFWALYCLAQCYLGSQRWEEAIDAFTECLKRRPDLLSLHLGRGIAHGRLKELRAAEEDFKRALLLRPQGDALYLVYLQWGAMHHGAKMFEKAEEDFRVAIKLRPERPEARALLGYVYEQQQKWDDALGQFRKVIDLNSPATFRAEAYAEMGRIWAMLAGGTRGPRSRALSFKAVESCDRSLALFRDGHLAHRVRAEVKVGLGEYREAVNSYDHYLQMGSRPGEPLRDVYQGRGLARMNLSPPDYPGAVNDFNHALLQGPRPAAGLWAYRGWAYYFTDSWQRGAADFEEALAVRRIELRAFPMGQDSDIHNGLGNCLVMLGQYRRAVVEAKEAYRLRPATANMMTNLACIFAQARARVQNDRKEDARDALAEDYTARAVALLRESLDMVPPSGRGRFWRDVIQADRTLDPIRKAAAFKRLREEMEKAAP